MIRLITFIFGLAVVVAAAVWMANEPGTVNLVWRGWRIDTSIGVLAAAVVVAVLAILLVLRILSIFSRSVRAFAAAQKERKMKRGLVALGDGFAAVQAGQGSLAQRLAKDASKLLDNNSAVLVLRKEAASLGGDSREMHATAMALLNRPQTELTALRTLANKAMNEGDVVGALRHAQKALARKDAPPWALNVVLDVQISTERWTDALAVLETKLGKNVFQPDAYNRLRSRLLVREANRALNNGDSVNAAATAKKAMDLLEGRDDAVSVYARAMAAQGKGRKASSAVEKAWQSKPSAELLSAYKALVPGESKLDWAKRIENLAKLVPEHTESRLGVAEASLNAELWGQARNRLSTLTSEDVDPGTRARAARLMADIEKRERGDSDAASKWLTLALAARPADSSRDKKPESTQDLLSSD